MQNVHCKALRESSKIQVSSSSKPIRAHTNLRNRGHPMFPKIRKTATRYKLAVKT